MKVETWYCDRCKDKIGVDAGQMMCAEIDVTDNCYRRPNDERFIAGVDVCRRSYVLCNTCMEPIRKALKERI